MSEIPGKPRARNSALAAAAFILAATFAPATPAAAASNPLATGATTIHLSPAFVKALKRGGVKLTALAPLTVKGTTIVLPVEGGELDSDSGRGVIDNAGRLKLKSPRGAAILRNFVLKTSSTPLYAVVTGAQLKLTTGSGLSLTHDGFGSDVTYKTLKLTQNFAQRLNTKLHLKGVFSQGLAFGQVQSKTQPASFAIAPKGGVTFTPNAETFAKLAKRNVSINPVFPAELSSGSFNLPLVSLGTIAPDALSGTVRSGGSMEMLQLQSESYGKITMHEIWFNLGEKTATCELNIEPSPPYRGKTLMTAILTLTTSGDSVSANPSSRTLSVSGITVGLNPVLAATFNEVLAKGEGEVFKAGEPLGTISFSATAE